MRFFTTMDMLLLVVFFSSGVTSCRRPDIQRTPESLVTGNLDGHVRAEETQLSKDQILAIADAVARDRGWWPQDRMAYEKGHALWQKSLGGVRLPNLEGHDYQAVIYVQPGMLLDGGLSVLVDKNTGEVLMVAVQ